MADPLIGLRARLDSLAASPAERLTLADRAALALRSAAPDTPELLAIDEGLDAAGVHTLADARILARLLDASGSGPLERLASTARRLRRRIGRAREEFEDLLTWAEREKRREGAPVERTVRRLEELFVALVRAWRVAEVLEQPDRPHGDLFAPLPRRTRSSEPPENPRVAAAEYLYARARASALDQRRKRRDLDAAHEILLRLGSEVERDRVRTLRARVAAARAGVRGHQATGGQDMQALSARLAAGDAAGLWSRAASLYDDAAHSGDAALMSASRRVLAALEPGLDQGHARALERDPARRLLGAVGEEGVLAAYLSESYGELDGRAGGGRDPLLELALDLDEEKWTTFELGVGVGSFFDVEEVTDEVDDEVEPVGPAPMVPAPHPTPWMTIEQTSRIEELPNFIISDPRLVLYDLAAGRQLARSWLLPATPPARKKRGAVRVYVCDASGSMRGARARFRDAVLIAELNNLSVREARGEPRTPIYYSFFNEFPTELARVDSSDEAMRVVRQLFRRSPAEGQTDITYALESAFLAIRDARGRDPDLGRATVVLITDGEDHVDLERIREARAPVGELEITLNFISLGRENRDLKQLVIEQREAGRRAFYYHLGDREVSGVRSDFDAGQGRLLPARPLVTMSSEHAALKEAVDALVALAESRRVEPQQALPASRFPLYFPDPKPAPPGRLAHAAAERAADLLQAVAETVRLAPAEQRPAEAVLLLEHLLKVYGWKPTAWVEAIERIDARGRQALQEIRLLCPTAAGQVAEAGGMGDDMNEGEVARG